MHAIQSINQERLEYIDDNGLTPIIDLKGCYANYRKANPDSDDLEYPTVAVRNGCVHPLCRAVRSQRGVLRRAAHVASSLLVDSGCDLCILHHRYHVWIYRNVTKWCIRADKRRCKP